MVFLNLPLLVRSRGPDEFWRKRRIFKLAAHYRSRTRNVYTFAIRSVHRALAYATKGRKLKKLDMVQLWNTRLEAGCQQYGVALDTFKEGLARSDILLNKKTLSDLAIWEPRSFEALVNISRERAAVEGIPDIKRRSAFNQVYGLNNLKLD
ncbi:39S ribosomal protein L20, mitochondrial isoform X2 [Drosophila hydei]|uniref:Large ribosomal subunit protein bL20m n=1 Tax=Drosophila hydei TaxID=7224 RepID=A0A6J1LLW1_DROHY|nr:39S ribosomal protein L20, mitochondrial isoform X2 [Drosophila hydei]